MYVCHLCTYVNTLYAGNTLTVTLANSGDPEEMQHNAAFNQGLLVGGRVMRSLLQLSERWPCYVLFVGWMKFASLESNLGKILVKIKISRAKMSQLIRARFLLHR